MGGLKATGTLLDRPLPDPPGEGPILPPDIGSGWNKKKSGDGPEATPLLHSLFQRGACSVCPAPWSWNGYFFLPFLPALIAAWAAASRAIGTRKGEQLT